ncbi:MAG: hypothetical protein US74_C0019G0012 [Parcubacteria group bacterium GW2011_GWA2_38_13]|nr:MAG: hypothetical protein US74_C0019G0012 [Parcubacteria group bacterium GW2011_GWA2_38_13]
MKEKHKDLTGDLRKSLLYHDPTVDARLVRVLTELKTGFSFLETFIHDKVVTFFGSARIKTSDPYYKKAQELAGALAKNGITIITGGGPGIMEGANRGADEAGGRSAGINIFLPRGERKNRYVHESVGFYYFFNRKVILDYAAEAFVFFPGGYGTLDELFEICNLMNTRKIKKNIPIILFGKKFWAPLLQWLEHTIAKKKLIAKNELKIFYVTDSIQKATEMLKKVKNNSTGNLKDK